MESLKYFTQIQVRHARESGHPDRDQFWIPAPR